MVLKGEPVDEHPRHELRKIARADERGGPVAADDGDGTEYHHGNNAAPAQSGVDECAEALLYAVLAVVQKI